MKLTHLLLVLSAALYVGCSPAGNEETGNSPPEGSEPFMPLAPVKSLKDFVLAPEPAVLAGVEFANQSGEKMGLGDLKGRFVLLNFWATWCAPCKQEMPALERLQVLRGGDDFIVVAMSNDREGTNAVTPYFDEAGFTALEKFYDPKGNLTRALGVTGLPTTILINAEGLELGRIEGPAEWDSEDALALIDRAMAGP